MLCQDGGKNMALMIRNDSVLIKCNEIWNKIKKTLKIKFHSMLVYDEKLFILLQKQKKNIHKFIQKNANIKIKKIKMPEFIDAVLESELVLVLNNLLFVDCVLNNAQMAPPVWLLLDNCI